MFKEKQLAVRVVKVDNEFAFIGISGTEILKCLGNFTDYATAILFARDLGFDVINEQRSFLEISLALPSTYANTSNTSPNSGNVESTTERTESERQITEGFAWLPSAKI